MPLTVGVYANSVVYMMSVEIVVLLEFCCVYDASDIWCFVAILFHQ